MQQTIKIAPSQQVHPLEHRPGVQKRRWRKNRLELIALPAGIVLLISLWALIAKVGDYPTFILPDPLSVFNKLVEITFDGTLWHHTQTTLVEIVGGLALAGMVAVAFFLVQRWRVTPAGQTSAGTLVPVATAPAPQRTNRGNAAKKHALLEAIADLDDAFESGEMDEGDYKSQRQALKSQLTAVWQ